MLGNYQGPDQPAIDPETQAALEKWQQEQMIRQLAGQQGGYSSPKNMGEGINALGGGLVDALVGFKQADALKQQQAINAKLMSGLGGGVGAMPFPQFTPNNLPSVSPSGGALPSALQSTSPIGKGPVQAAVSDTLRKAGLNETAIAGVMGNIQQESSFSPGVSPNNEGGGGLFQHRAERYRNLLASGDTSPVGQVKFALSELGGPSAPGLSIAKLNSAQSPGEAAVMFGRGFERPSERYANWAGRERFANSFAKNLGPASYGVPKGQVAGPGVPSDIEPTTPEGRLAALTAARGGAPAAPLPPPRPPETMDMAGSARNIMAAEPAQGQAASVNQAPPPTPMGPPQGLTPPVGGDPGAAAALPGPAAPPVAPPAPPPQAAVPPAPVARAPMPAAGAGGTAYDPATGRFLGPGEKIPGYAPAPMSSTGGPGGGLEGLLASLFGGGAAQAAPAVRPQPSMARGLAGAPPQQAMPSAPAGVPRAPIQQPQGASVAPPAAGGGQANPVMAQYEQRYNALSQQAQALRQRAQVLAVYGHPAASQFASQANQYEQEAQKIWEMGAKMQQEEAAIKPVIQKFPDESIHSLDPRTGKDLGIIAPAALKQPESLKPGDFVRDPSAPGGYRQVGEVKPDKPEKPEIRVMHDQTGNEVQVQVHSDGTVTPLQLPGAALPALGGGAAAPAPVQGGGSGPVTEEGMEEAPKEGALAGTKQPAISGGLTKEEQGRLDSIQGAGEGYKNQLKSILSGDATPPAGTKAGNARAQAILNNLQLVRPGFSPAQAVSQVATRKAFSPAGQEGKSILALNALLDHTATAMEASEEYGKGSFGDYSKAIYDKYGWDPLGTYAKENKLAAAGALSGGETTKFVTGSSQGGGQTERAEAAARVANPKLPPEAREAAAKVLVRDSLEKGIEEQARWHASFQGQKVADFPILSEKSIESAKKLGFSDWFDKDDNLVGPGKGVPKPPPPQESLIHELYGHPGAYVAPAAIGLGAAAALGGPLTAAAIGGLARGAIPAAARTFTEGLARGAARTAAPTAAKTPAQILGEGLAGQPTAAPQVGRGFMGRHPTLKGMGIEYLLHHYLGM